MKKIISLFKRDYEGNRQVFDEVVPGAEWVLAGEGVATIKYDGTACMVREGRLFKRHDRKLTKKAYRRKKGDPAFVPAVEDFKPAPGGWEAAEEVPNRHTGHWPGWLPVGDGPEDKWHRAAAQFDERGLVVDLEDGTYELIGQKVQGNPYGMQGHALIAHGSARWVDMERGYVRLVAECGLSFEGVRLILKVCEIEGIVWCHPDGRMVKIKRRDFGFNWPVEEAKL